MPIVSGSYVAPTWTNNAAPAIDAAELQALCDTVEASQTRLCGEIVARTGTGTSSSSSPCTLTFSRAVQAIIALGVRQTESDVGGYADTPATVTEIVMAEESTSFQSGHGFQVSYRTTGNGGGNIYGKKNSANTTYSWYCTNSPYGTNYLNVSGTTYYFLGLWGADE